MFIRFLVVVKFFIGELSYVGVVVCSVYCDCVFGLFVVGGGV